MTHKGDPANGGGDSAGDDVERAITPAGPLRKEDAHEVRPDEMVRQDEDGTLRIVSRSDPPATSG